MLEQTRELAADAKELNAATEGKLTDHLATVLAARYAAALAGWNGEADEPFRQKLRVLRGLCQDIVALRRADHNGARLQMEQERVRDEQEKTEEEVIAHFEQWLKKAELRDLVCREGVSPEERHQGIRKMFALKPEPPQTPEKTEAEPAPEVRDPLALTPESPEATGTANPDSGSASPDQMSNEVKPGQTGQTRSNQVKRSGLSIGKVVMRDAFSLPVPGGAGVIPFTA